MNTSRVSFVKALNASAPSALFWGWNVVFLGFILLGFGPQVFPQLIKSIQSGVTPLIYLFYTLVVIAIPVAAILIGIFFLRSQPKKLFALGYVVEWPLMIILLFRYFMIREGNPAITVLLVWLAIAEAVFLWHLLDDKIDARTPFWRYLRLVGLTLLFSGTIYAAAWLAFYLPPLAGNTYIILKEIFRNPSKCLRPNDLDLLVRASHKNYRILFVSLLGRIDPDDADRRADRGRPGVAGQLI